ncbi:diacylglyceryl transferase [Streptomyces sp. CC53]|uniref:roadblock/LC7 domain-containing protein n=1 Tax=unclassified Streptomyces TaxID=2593676 RepID=UPI0008DC7080|nr:MULTISPECIES: roadblock/LC7 domain-containing protein [unclassified Streptomyces]OII63833.1 diacylglyceryl transferase [Streptomyces sp. CC53]OII66332.1 diacylglyceryl transferase [Streptomyces sp. CC77]
MRRALRQRAEKRQLLSAEPYVLGELRRLRSRVPRLTGALAACDGFVLAHDVPGGDTETVAALTAAAVGAARGLAGAAAVGGLRELLLRGEHGYVAAYAAGGAAILTLLAEPEVNVGRLHLEGRRSGALIGELVDGALVRPDPPPQTP